MFTYFVYEMTYLILPAFGGYDVYRSLVFAANIMSSAYKYPSSVCASSGRTQMVDMVVDLGRQVYDPLILRCYQVYIYHQQYLQ